jgi:signal transduction histidine kinase
MEPDDILNASTSDPLQARIEKVQLTTKHLRELHRSRNDTVAFISHDIRAPLGAAMMLLEQFDKNKHSDRMRHMLGRAYNMSESFLQASRAEMANVNKFHELDMVSIVQQAVDEIYEIVVKKQLKLFTILPEDAIWIRGDFGLLLRAVSNILINAVTYSPEGGVIKVELTSDQQQLTLYIIDQGPGISATKIPKIFRRFSRLDAEHQSRKGSGLGLYFVSVTVKKHHGSVSVQSKLGKGSAFIINLPLERRREYKVVEHDRRVARTRSFSDTM